MDMCRACLSTEGEMSRINQECLVNYTLLTNLTIELDNDLPLSMCRVCWDNIEAFIDFRNKCLTSEAKLQMVLSNVNTDIDTKQDSLLQKVDMESAVNVKLEPEYDYFNDDFTDIDIKVEENDELPISKTVTKEATRRKRGRPRKNDAPKVEMKKTLRKGKEKALRNQKVSTIDKDQVNACGLCEKMYEDRESLSRHLTKHQKGSQCSTCKEELRPWPRLMAHRITHLPESARRCHLCWKMFRVDFYLEDHYLTKHYDGEHPGIQCRFCDKKKATAIKMKCHLWSQHNNKKFICDYCKSEFPNKNNLLIHIYRHSSKMNYFCDKCSYSCKYHNNLRLHMLRKHDVVKYRCKCCTEVFRTAERLAAHKCITSICPVCGRELHRRSALARHLKMHSDERTYKCPRCPKTYKARSALTIHLLKHDNVRPYKCEYCSMRFFTNAVKLKHQRVHTGEKPFVCKICGKGFTGNHNLKVHMKVHGLDLVVKRGSDPAARHAFPFEDTALGDWTPQLPRDTH